MKRNDTGLDPEGHVGRGGRGDAGEGDSSLRAGCTGSNGGKAQETGKRGRLEHESGEEYGDPPPHPLAGPTRARPPKRTDTAAHKM